MFGPPSLGARGKDPDWSKDKYDFDDVGETESGRETKRRERPGGGDEGKEKSLELS